MLDDKLGILDIKARLNNKINCDIEMQVVDKKNIEKRLLFYWSKMYVHRFKQGKNYSKLPKSIVILFSNYNLENLKVIDKYITKWNIREEEYYQTILTEVLEIYIIELPKFSKINEGKTKKLDAWVNFIRNQVVSMDEENEAIKKAQKVLEDISSSENERRIAELRLKHIMDQKAIEESGFDKGIKYIAKKMKERNVDTKEICMYTGLTKEEIEKL